MRKLKSVIFIILVLLIGCSSQNSKSDAFGNFEADETIISAQNSGEILELNIEEEKWVHAAKTSISIGKAYVDIGQNEIANEYFERAIEYDLRNHNWDGVALTKRKIGDIALEQGNLDKAINDYLDAKNYNAKSENNIGIAISYAKVGDIHNKRENYHKAIEYYEKSLEHDLIDESYENAAHIKMKIGNIYAKLNILEEAQKSFEEAKGLALNSNEWIAVAYANRRIGDLYNNQEEYDKAIEYYLLNEEIDNKYENWSEIAYVYNLVGDIYVKQGKLEDALKYYTLAIKNDKKIEKSIDISLLYAKIAKIYQDWGLIDDVLKSFDKAFQWAKKSQEPKIQGIVRLKKANFYRDERKWQKAIELYEEIVKDKLEQEKIRDANYFEIQSLKCQARFQEGLGDNKKVAEIYFKISDKYRSINNVWYSTFYSQIAQLFQSDVLSQEVKHQDALDLLLQLKNQLNSFLEDRTKKQIGYLINLIKFRVKQVDLYINREKAYIAEEKTELNEAIQYFQKCSDIAKDVISPKFDKDYQLYQCISVYYQALANQIQFQIFLRQDKRNIDSLIDYLEKYVIKRYKEAYDGFSQLNQEIRVRNINYEMLLLYGKIHEMKGEIADAHLKYKDALKLYKEIEKDKEKIHQFNESLNSYFKHTRRDFPTEKFFLRMPSLGNTHVIYCNLPDIDLKERFFHISFENLPPNFITLTKNTFRDEEYFDYFEEELYILDFPEGQQNKRFITDRDTLTWNFKMKLPASDRPIKKIYQLDLLDKNQITIKTHELEVEFKEEIIEIDEKTLAELELLNIEQIKTYLETGGYKEAQTKLDEALAKSQNFDEKIILKMLFDSISAYLRFLNFEYNSTMKGYIEIINRLENNIILISDDQIQNHLKEILEQYLSNLRKHLGIIMTNTRRNPKLKNIDNSVNDIYRTKIKDAYIKEDYTYMLQLSIAYLERLMDKRLFKKHNINYDKIDWSQLDSGIIEKYKEVMRKELRMDKEAVIYLKDQLEFESARCLLMVIDDEFHEFCQNHSKTIQSVRQTRNDSYLEHGTGAVDKNSAEMCLNLINEIQSIVNIPEEEPNLMQMQLKLFNSFLSLFDMEA